MDAEELVQLPGGDGHGQADDETVEHRSRHEVGQEAQLDQAGDDEEGAGEDGQADGQGIERGRVAARGEAADDGEREHRHRRAGADVELSRGAEDGIREWRHEGGVEAGLGRHAGQRGIGHGLGHHQCPDRQGSDEVRAR